MEWIKDVLIWIKGILVELGITKATIIEEVKDEVEDILDDLMELAEEEGNK